MNHPILVTGATGTIGGYVVDELLQRKTKIRAFIRTPDQSRKFVERGVETVVGDLAEPESLMKAVEGVHQAFLLTPGMPYHPQQVEWATNFIRVTQQSDIKHIVLHSIWSADVDRSKPLAMQAHAQIEQKLQDTGLAYTILRTNFGMQALVKQGIGQTAALQGVIYTPLGSARVAFVDLRDVGAVAAVCLTEDGHAGKIYELSGPEVLNSSDLAHIISQVLNRNITFIEPTLEMTLQSFREAGLPEWFISDFPTLLAHNQSGVLARVTTAVRDVTGRNALSFEQFVRDHIDAFTAIKS
jgi:uncharacterized protein YbjT (DUF2867 family)